MLNHRARCGLLFYAVAVCSAALRGGLLQAQTQATTSAELDELAAIRAAANYGVERPESRLRFLRGFNTSLTSMSQHDSASGWATIFYPTLSWRFNRRFGADVTVPAYTFLNIYTNVGTTAKPVYAFHAQRGGAWGDTVINLQADTVFHLYGYSGVFSLGLPTGNTGYGIGAGQVTYSFNNWFQRNAGRFTPNIALGYGDTSSLINQGILRDYIAVGPMAHFQAGSSVALTRSISFNAAAYEELPLAADLIYSTSGKGKKAVTTSTNKDPGEDNGFLTSLSIPLSGHLAVAGFYSRSLRDHTDTAGFSFTLTARSSRPE